MQDCVSCHCKDYCIPDECAEITKKGSFLSSTALEGTTQKATTLVYHIIKKESNTMTEMKLEVKTGTAEELRNAIGDLHAAFSGDVQPCVIEEKKSSKKATKKAEVKEDYTVQKTIAELTEEAKKFVAKGASNKEKIKAFLEEQKVVKLSLLPESAAPALQELLEG